MDGNTTIHNKKLIKRPAVIAAMSKTLQAAINCIAAVVLVLAMMFSVFVRSDEIESKDAVYAAGGSSAIVMEVSTKRIFYSSNIHQRLPMASTTKVMTALVVLENANLNDVVTVTRQAVGIEGSSIYLKEGEKLTVRELLYGLMLRSGNDAATALAIHTGGSVEGFVRMMNLKAKNMGLKNTHFTNPHGLHSPDHYTSGYDLAYISAIGMENPDFSKIVGTKLITINGVDGKRYLYNKNKILNNYTGGTGIKTGFTKNAGRCLVASSKRNGMEVVAVVLNCGPMFEECARLMNNAHNEYEMVNVCKAGESLGDIEVIKGKQSKAAYATKEDIYIPLKKDGSEKYNYNVIIPQNVNAPLKEGRQVGKIEIHLNDCLLFSKNVYSIDNVEKKGVLDYLKGIFK